MRNVLRLLLGVTACKPAASAVPACGGIDDGGDHRRRGPADGGFRQGESGSTVREPIQRGSASWPSPAHFEKVRD